MQSLNRWLGVAAAAAASRSQGEGAAAPSPEPVAALEWKGLVDKVESSGLLRVAQLMRDWLRVIELAPGKLVFSLVPGLSIDPIPELRNALLKATGAKWQVDAGEGEGAPSLRELDEARQVEEAAAILKEPLVEAALAAFPGAEMIEDDGSRQRLGRQWTKRA